jgi:hypothetical protein
MTIGEIEVLLKRRSGLRLDEPSGKDIVFGGAVAPELLLRRVTGSWQRFHAPSEADRQG